MIERSLISEFSKEKIKRVKNYLLLIKYEALKADDYLKSYFRYDEIELILNEIVISGGAEELDRKIDRMKIQKKKKKKNNINSRFPIEEFGPFPKEVEDVLRENVIDNMDDLLNSNLTKGNVDSHVKEHINFMKEWYDFSRFEKKGKQLTKQRKNSKINAEINEEEK